MSGVDKTVTAEGSAAALAGTELVRIVQSGSSFKTTMSAIAAFAAATNSSVVPNLQTGTSYTVVTGDRSKLVTFSNASAIAVTLPQAGTSFPSGWFVFTENRGLGTVTITPTTSTIDGAASIKLPSGYGVLIASDGTNYYTMRAGFRNIPQNSQSAAYTTVLSDAGGHLLHPAADTNARTFTIDSNANVAYPIGTAITFVNETSQVLSIAITTDTLTLAGSTTTGTRSLAQNGVATALKVTSTKWIISGTGLT